MQVTELNSDGSQEKNHRVPLNEERLAPFLARFDRDTKVVFEATSNAYYLYDLLQPRAGEVLLANPLKLKAIASGKIKTDKIDSRTLARLLAADFIPEVWVPDKLTRDLRSLLHYRVRLNKIRTSLKNGVWAILTKNGLQFKKSDLFGKGGRSFLESLKHLPRLDQIILSSSLRLLDEVEKQIQALEGEIASLASKGPYKEQVEKLMGFSGIDFYMALLVLCEIGDISRFPHSKNLASYAGLVPSVHSSGETHRTGRITKQGRKYLRWAAIQIANGAARSEGTLKKFYLRIKKKRGHNVAIVALARKILTLIWKILTYQENYGEMKEESLRRKISRMRSLASPYVLEGDYPREPVEEIVREYILKDVREYTLKDGLAACIFS